MQTIETNGMRIPRLGLGTFRLKGQDCTQAVEQALALGYRHIDTAEMYGNEDAIGQALANTPVPRHEIHLTSKVWHDHLTPQAMRQALDQTLANLKTDHLDLYLIHWPGPHMNMAETMETLMDLKRQGRTRAIGVANFTIKLLDEARQAGAELACNQVEYHVLLSQEKLLAHMREHNLLLVAYCPLAQGRLTDHPALQSIATKHGTTPAQVALKWLLDQDAVAAIPKASRPETQQANLLAQDIALDDADRATIAALPKDQRFVQPAFAPAWD